MRAKDIVVGEHYVYQYGAGARRRKALVLSAGEKPLSSRQHYRSANSTRKQPTGTEIRLEDTGEVKVVNSIYILEPWEPYAEREAARQARVNAQQREYHAMDEMQDRLSLALKAAGMEDISTVLYHDGYRLKIHTAERTEHLCEVLEKYADAWAYTPLEPIVEATDGTTD